MTRTRRPYRAVRAVGAVVATLMVGVAVTSTVPGLLNTTRTETLALPDDTDVVTVSTSKGDVVVTEGEGRLSADLSYSFGQPEVELLDLGDGHVEARVVRCGDWCGVDLDLELPPGVSVRASTSLGDIDVSASGLVHARTHAGDITVDGAPTSIDAKTSLGDISVAPEQPVNQIWLVSSLGDLTAQLPRGTAYRLDLDTSIGEPIVEVEQSSGSAYRVNATTSMGDIRVLHP